MAHFENAKLSEPEQKTNRIVIHVHGSAGSHKSEKFMEPMADEYTKNGFGFLAFDNRGANTEGWQSEIFEDCSKDIQAAIDFAKSKGYTDITLQGHSYGAHKVLHYTMESGFDGKLVLLAPCDNSALEREHRIQNWKARDPKNQEMFSISDNTTMDGITQLKNEVLIQIGTRDKNIGQQNKQEFADYLVKAFKSANVKCDLIEGADHSYTGKHSELVSNVTGWLGAENEKAKQLTFMEALKDGLTSLGQTLSQQFGMTYEEAKSQIKQVMGMQQTKEFYDINKEPK